MELHTAPVLDDADVVDDVELPARKGGAAGLWRITLAKLKLYVTTAIAAKLLPSGGTTGQVLKKIDGTDFNVGWGADNVGTAGPTTLDGLTDVDTSTTPPTAGQVLEYDDVAGLWKPATPATGGGTGGSAGTAPTIRGHVSSSFNANTTTLAFPAGSVAGDIALLFTGHAYGTNKPAGWSVINNPNIGNFMGAALVKELTAADITAGSVTITFGGSFNGCAAMVVLVGTTFNHLLPPHSIYADPNDTRSNEMFNGSVQPGNLVIGYAAKRAAVNVTITYDGVAGTTLESVNAASASFMLSYAIVGGDGKLRLFDGLASFNAAGSGECFYMIGCS